MRLAEHDHVIEPFATNRPDEPLDVGILPRRARGPLRRRDFQRQYAWKPRRCQPITVSGLTIVIACRIDEKSRYSQTNSIRSEFVRRIRLGSRRLGTLSCWRRIRFSASSRACDLNKEPTACTSSVRISTTGRCSFTSARPRQTGCVFQQAQLLRLISAPLPTGRNATRSQKPTAGVPCCAILEPIRIFTGLGYRV